MGKRLSLFLSVQPHFQRLLEIRRPGRQADLLSPCPAEVMNEWSCTFTLSYAFMAFTSYLMHAECPHDKYKDQPFRCNSIPVLSSMAGAYNDTGIVA